MHAFGRCACAYIMYAYACNASKIYAHLDLTCAFVEEVLGKYITLFVLGKSFTVFCISKMKNQQPIEIHLHEAAGPYVRHGCVRKQADIHMALSQCSHSPSAELKNGH